MPIEEKVLTVISETLGTPKKDINTDANIVDLVADSIQLFELLVRFEKELGRKISYEEIAHIEKVRDIIAYADTVYAVS